MALLTSTVSTKTMVDDKPLKVSEQAGATNSRTQKPATDESWWKRFLIENRGFFVVFFVVPLSLAYDVWFRLRAWVIQKFYSAPELHQQRVQEISQRIQEYNQEQPPEGGKRKKLCTARGGWQSISPGFRDYKKQSQCIPINLYDILSFDEGDGDTRPPSVHVEPMVNMGQISHYLIPRGYTLPVLPEMDDLTVGGLYMGVGIETSSHKYGLFNDVVLEAEIILACGKVVTCSRTTNRDLFDALPWSYGTLGFLASVRLVVVPCKPYVRLEHFPVTDRKKGVKLIEELSMERTADGKVLTAEFVEALQYSEQKMVVMRGNFADEVEAKKSGKINSIGYWFKPWFYKHVESFLDDEVWKAPKEVSGKTEPVYVEYIPLRDYYHRHTKSIFWELELILQPFDGNFWLFRWLLGWALPPKVSFLKLTQPNSTREMYEREHVIQDMLVPISKSEEGLKVFHQEYDVYPLWICPFRLYDYTDAKENLPHRCFLKKPLNASKQSSGEGTYELYLDLGAYGVPRAVLEKREFDIRKSSRAVEGWVRSVNGFQMLYADSYLSQEEFNAMFDHRHYSDMKKKYDPNSAFPEIYSKVIVRWNKDDKKNK